MNLLLLIGLELLGLFLTALGVNLARVEGREAWRYYIPFVMVGLTIFAGALIGIGGTP